MRNRVLVGHGSLILVVAVASIVMLAPSAFATEPSTEVNDAASFDQVTKDSGGPRLFVRTNYVWPFSSGPYYGDREASRRDRSRPGMLHTWVGSFDLTKGMPVLPAELSTPNRVASLGSQYFVLVVDPARVRDGSFDSLRQTISSQGGGVLTGMPVGGYIVRLTPGALAAVEGNPQVITLFPYPAAFKISPSLGRSPLPDAEKAVSEFYALIVGVFRGENVRAIADQIEALGAIVQVRGNAIHVEIHRSRVADIAQIQGVMQVIEDVPRFVQSEETTSTMQVGGCGANVSPCLIPFFDAEIRGGGRSTCSGDTSVTCQKDADCQPPIQSSSLGTCTERVAPQTLVVIDSGLQLDAADLSDTSATAGTPGASHRKVAVYQPTTQFGGEGDNKGCDSRISGGMTHGHVVSGVALGSATDVFASYGDSYFLDDQNGNPWKVDGVAPDARLVLYDSEVTPNSGGCPGILYVGVTYSKVCDSDGVTYCLDDFDCAGPGGPCRPDGGFLLAGYGEGGRAFNMSYGSYPPGSYSSFEAHAIDLFLWDHRDAMTFASAGNAGGDYDMDGFPDGDNVSEPGTLKNGLCVGASLNSGSGVNTRAGFSSVGPATTSSNRIAPQLMAPGSDSNSGSGIYDPYSCRTNDDDQHAPVECIHHEQNRTIQGTSFSSPALAGSALLVRDYFAQGFYPDAERKNANEIPVISGAMVKAILITSAEFMSNIANPGGTLTEGMRFNNEQGYGRVELDNALPLATWPSSPTGLVVVDGSVRVCSNFPDEICVNSASDCTDGASSACVAPANNTAMTGSVSHGVTESHAFAIEDVTQELKIACVWIDPPAEWLQNDLDITLTGPAPNSRVYMGNFFSEDVDRDDVLDTAAGTNDENCIDDYDGGGPTPAEIDEGAWSVPTNSCGTIIGIDRYDHDNTTEAIFLSPDPKGDSFACFDENRCERGGDDPATTEDESDDNQLEAGIWTLEVTGSSVSGLQDYSCAIVGPIAARSSVLFDLPQYACRDKVTITINESDPAADSDVDLSACGGGEACLEAEVQGRTTVTVVDANGTIVDQEDTLGYQCPDDAGGNCTSLSFSAQNVLMTDGTARDLSSTYNNGMLDVRSGETLRVEYADEINSAAIPDQRRFNDAEVDCRVAVAFGGVIWPQFGLDSAVLIESGCERDARGKFTFGLPDRYMDAGEILGYRIAFTSAETSADLIDVELSLRCVEADVDSPADCQPGTTQCPDPDRENNPDCGPAFSPWMTVVDSPKTIGSLPAGTVTSANFTIVMNPVISGLPEVDMLLAVTATKAGRGVESLIASRHKLDRDDFSLFYSTDFPQGGIEEVDWNNDEVVNPTSCISNVACSEAQRGTPTTSLDFDDDYRFETWAWSSLEANPINQGLQAPWNFDDNDGGFTVSVHPDSADYLVNEPSQWGEDKNGNGLLDKVCENAWQFPCAVSDQCGTCANGGTCSNDPSIICQVQADCPTPPIDRTCDPIYCQDASDCTQVGGPCDTTIEQCVVGDEDRDPINWVLDNNWSTKGGCGWQTKSPGVATGGIWHTGTIDVTTVSTCAIQGGVNSQCQLYETLGATSSPYKALWYELLTTPYIGKVNQAEDAEGNPIYTSEILNWAWNLSIDLRDSYAYFSWEFDLDTGNNVASHLDRYPVFNFLQGPYGSVAGGAPALTDGFPLFASTHVCDGGLPGTVIACRGDADCDDLGLNGACLGGTFTCSGSGNACATDLDCKCVENPNPGTGFCAGPGCSVNGSSGTHAGFCQWTGTACTTNAQCNHPGGSPDRGPCIISGDRVGKNSCFFEGGGATSTPFALAEPWDDDQNNDSDASTDEYVFPAGPKRNFDITQVNGPDMRFATLEDVYGKPGNTFQGALGFLNVQGWPPPGTVPENGYGLGIDDMVVQWRELRQDKDVTDCSPGGQAGEGACAAIEIDTSNLYEGGAILGVSIIDPHPYDSTNPQNDCNNDGDFTDIGTCSNDSSIVCTDSSDCAGNVCDADSHFADDTDCNDNGIVDVVAVATSESLDQEVVACDEIATGVYRGTITISVTFDVDDVLFVATTGTALPTVNILYFDRDDGTGNVCPNSADPLLEGFISEIATVDVPKGNVVMTAFRIVDHVRDDCDGTPGGGPVPCGDGDPFADTNELIDLYVKIANKSDITLRDVVVRVSTNSAEIDCILQPSSWLGPLAPRGTVGAVVEAGPFTFRVAGVSRATVAEKLWARFSVTITSSTFDAASRPQEVIFEMDLDGSGGGSVVGWHAGFELGGLENPLGGEFIQQTLDEGKQTLALSDGWRCQYNNPDFPNGSSYQNGECFLGFTTTTQNQNDWHRHGGTKTSPPDGGRSHSGLSSLHYGFHSGPGPNDDTIRLKQLDAAIVQDADIINVGLSGSPKLTFWHQISLMDHRGSSTPEGEAVDRAVVQVQLQDDLDNPVGDWIKIHPFENIYDVQGTDAFPNCSFDPTDDGNDEDSFFSNDPTEIHGPSSTCFPEFVFGYQGDTDWQKFFSANRTGRASDPESATGLGAPGFTGMGPGTWVQTSFDLSRFRGRRIKLRFLATTIELGTAGIAFDYLSAQYPSNSPYEDGWYIDDVEIPEAISSPVALDVDTKTNTAFPACGTNCGEISPVLTVDPVSVAVPGGLVELNASASTADRCVDGTLQFQFWIDENDNGTLARADGDTLLKDFTDNPIYVDAPLVDTVYGVEVRCSSDPSCPTTTDAVLTELVIVACPDNAVTVTGVTPFLPNLTWSNVNNLAWGITTKVDVLRGDLGTLRTGLLTTSVSGCTDDWAFSGLDVGSLGDPAVGDGFYFVVRPEDTFCNEDAGSYSTKTNEEDGAIPQPSARDTLFNAAGSACAE